MSRLNEIIEYNSEFVSKKLYKAYRTTKFPDKKMIIFSCMDTRLTRLLPEAMNIKNGDAKIIKNAGATVTRPFGSMMRSIIVAVYELGAEEVFVVGHSGCGMSSVDTDDIIEKMRLAGIDNEIFKILKYTGIDLNKWLHGFDCVKDSVESNVEKIKQHPLLPKTVKVHGLIMDSDTGELEVVVNGDTDFSFSRKV